MADTKIPTESANTNPRALAREAFAEWEDYRGLKPFSRADSPQATDRCNYLLSGAVCILTTLAAAHDDAAALVRMGETSALDERHPDHMAGALEGVSALINLAAFMMAD